MEKTREDVLGLLWAAQDEAYDLMSEYNSIVHYYGEEPLYQAEGMILDLVAAYPDITVTELARILHNTPSACSQTVRKLRDKGLVEQTRNRENNRLYNLSLTEEGQKKYREHQKFTQNCQMLTFQRLEGFTHEQLQTHLEVQRKLNEAYRDDIARSREHAKKRMEDRKP